MAKINKQDILIINALIDNGRKTCMEIAKEVGNMTERAVRYRINRLIAEGVIQICAVPAPEKLGYPVIADILIEVESANIQKVAKMLAEYECVSYVGCSIGGADISIQIFVPDNPTVYRFVTEVIGKIPGVIKAKPTILPKVYKDTQHWKVPVSKSDEFRKIRKNNMEDYDE